MNRSKRKQYLQNKRLIALLIVQLLVISSRAQLPSRLLSYIQQIIPSNIGHTRGTLSCKEISATVFYVSVRWQMQIPVAQDDAAVTIIPAFKPTFNWAPLLTPDSNHIIAQHVFRSPALIVATDEKLLSVIPDLGLLQKGSAVPWYMDMDAQNNRLMLGMAGAVVKEHVLYTKTTGAVFPQGTHAIGFFCIVSDKRTAIQNPFAATGAFLWRRWGQPLYNQGEPLQRTNLEPYVRQTYQWAFTNWKKVVWQQFELEGKQVGAPAFIVNYSQSPNYTGLANQREFLSIWNQAWFNSLRSAQGLYRYAQRTGNDSLKQYALQTKELALSFPQQEGFFKSVVATEMETVESDGKKYVRSKGWNARYWGNSNRNPYTWDAKASPYHIADMSYTAYWMLVWYGELEKDQRLLTYAKHYADALLKLQDTAGFFPAWLSLKNREPMDHLNQSPETSISVTFLLKLFAVTKDTRYRNSAEKAMRAVIKNNIPQGQWEDFETYWSCSRVGSDAWVGKKIVRNNMFKQNTFSIFWTAQALLETYHSTRKKQYLETGQRVLDELLLWQAVWQPPYMAVRTLGGFGVMNADAEWDDSRQSLFAELILQYGKLLKHRDYLERGLAALRASFTMMYTPLNPRTMQQWQARWPFFNKADYGFMMENYGHDGVTDAQGLGIGEFTIYDWGNGAAAEAYNRIYDHYGPALLSGRF